MLKKMLEAVSTMLESKGADEVLRFKTQVTCAKTILDKIIEGLPETTSTVQIPSVWSPTLAADMPTAVTTNTEEPIKKKEPIPEGKYKIIKDDNNRLVRIDGLALDAKVELDGKVMTHQEAKGKKFISGRII